MIFFSNQALYSCTPTTEIGIEENLEFKLRNYTSSACPFSGVNFQQILERGEKNTLTETKVAAVYAAANTPAGFEETETGETFDDSEVKWARTMSTDSANSTRSLSMAPPRRPGEVSVCVLEGVVTL